MKEINLAWIYPDVLNMHGDRGNIMGLISIAKAMGINLIITKVSNIEDITDFNEIDLLYMGACQIKDINFVIEDLSCKVQEINEYVNKGKYLLAIGSTGCIIGKQLEMVNGDIKKGLELIDISAKELNRTEMPYVTREVYGDDINFRTKSGMEIIGCQIQRVDYTLGHEVEAFGELLYGYGNNHLDGKEGATYKNIIITNTVGALVTSNPWFGVELLKLILIQKGEEVEEFNEEDIDIMTYAREGLKLKKKFIKEKRKQKGIIYKEEQKEK